ncbi:MAG TPA: hypothetical protein VHI98_22205 [Vicinamibacterales bacterium]|jgi:hypothetical protein|nr:hypothetical protein [Vicinamibacterales bacterium]
MVKTLRAARVDFSPRTAAVAVSPVSGSTARATVTLSGLAGGGHKITATYLGNSTYRGTTAGVNQTVI